MKKLNLIGIAMLIIGSSLMPPEKVFSHSVGEGYQNRIYKMKCPDNRWKHMTGRNGHKHECIGVLNQRNGYFYCTECQKQ